MNYLELSKREVFLKSILSILKIDAKLIIKVNGTLLEAEIYNFSSNSTDHIKTIHLENITKKYCFKDISLPYVDELQGIKEYEINQLINTYNSDLKIFELALFDFITSKNVNYINIENEKFSNYLYNVKFINSNLHLNFYKLSETDNIEIVSLKLITN